ncbi:MAG: cyclopropane-fatty-acyl-phospholipid synthase family protein [Pseudomonadota bacterium]
MSADSMTPESLNFQSTPEHAAPNHAMPPQAKLALKALAKLQYGALALKLPSGGSLHFGDSSPPITLTLKNWQLFHAVLKSGDIGLAETYIDGHWHTDNLQGLIALFIRNRTAVESLIYGTWWGSLWYRVKHLFNRNSRSGSRKNIHAHYDIGNDFYRLWLDPSMTYSAALYCDGHVDNLHEAQVAKYRRILDQLQLQPHQRVLEIGCGWGGFAELAAAEQASQVTSLTLSTEQLAYAKNRLPIEVASGQVEFRLCDYRDIHHTEPAFDAIASIEMFEAVGEAYWPSYFACLARNLKAHGRACIQTITIDDALFERYRKGTDFIQQFIFPGGMLPSPRVFRQLAAQHGLRVVDEFAFGLDYARTLAEWRLAFNAQLPQVKAQGFDDTFLRTWEFYLSYSEGGFRAESIDVMQFTLEKI